MEGLLPGGIKGRLFLLIILVLLPMVLLLGWIYLDHYENRRVHALQTELEVAQGVATTFSTYVEDLRRLNHSLGQAIITFDTYTDEKVKLLLARAVAEYPTVRNLSWVGTDGIVRASTEPGLIGRDLSGRSCFAPIIDGAPWTISDLIPAGIVAAVPTFAITTAVREEHGALRGVMVAGIEPSRLRDTLQRPDGGVYAIFDRQGHLVYSSLDAPLTWEERILWRDSDPLLRNVLERAEAQAGVVNLEIPGGEWMAARVPIPGTGWVAGAARPEAIALAPVLNRLIEDAALAGVIASLAFLLACLLSRTIAGPLLQLEQDARAPGAGGIDMPEDRWAPKEVRRLRGSVSQMAADLIHRAEAVEEQQWQLRAAKKTAEEANRAKDTFLVNMSHELRTPMTVIMTSLELLQESRIDAGQRQFVEMAGSASQRLLGIIDDLLDISRIEAGRLKIEERPYDLRQCVGRQVELFAGGAGEKGLRLCWEVDPRLPAQVSGDPDRIGQVLAHLVGNAVKFTDQGEIVVSVANWSDLLVFTVRDTGIGIPAGQSEQLFMPFTQADGSLTRRHGGTGLGLAICRELVELMGGTIRMESEEGRGSTFTFTLPLQPAEAPAAESTAPGRWERPPRLLLAEDDSMVRKLVQSMLVRRGWDVTICENGRQTVARWAEGEVDLVLMDLQMPDLDGIAATRAIRERESDRRTPIIALTGHAFPEDREECLAAGMDGFLAKPVHMEELYAVVEKCLAEAGYSTLQ